jgi:hypothetical protein
MTTVAPEPTPLPPHTEADLHVSQGISLTRIYLPFVMVITIGVCLAVAGYRVGGIVSDVARDKTETEKRLSAIEKEVTAIKTILAERAEFPQGCFPRSK